MSQPPEPPPGPHPGPGYGPPYGPAHGAQYGPQHGPSYGPSYGESYGPPVAPTNGKATAALITGIASLVLSWCCGLGLAGIVAIVLGVKARNEIQASGGTQQGDGLALGGIVTGAIAAVLGLLVLVVLALAIVTGAVVEPSTTYGGTEKL